MIKLESHVQKDDKGKMHFYPNKRFGKKYQITQSQYDKTERKFLLKNYVIFILGFGVLLSYRMIAENLGIPPTSLLILFGLALFAVDWAFLKILTKDLKPSTRDYVRQPPPKYIKIILWISIAILALIAIPVILGDMGYTIKDFL